MKLVFEKIGVLRQNTNINSKPGWRIQLKMRMKNSTLSSKNDKTKEKLWDMLLQKAKNNTRNNEVKFRRNKPKCSGERRKIKKILRQNKTRRTEQDVPNQRKKIYLPVGGDDKKHAKNRREGSKNVWSKIWQRWEPNKNVERIRTMEKEREKFEEIPKPEIHIDLPRTTLKKYQIGKRHAGMVNEDFILKNHLHPCQTSNRNE